MSAPVFDPYLVVLIDLQRTRDLITKTIDALEALRPPQKSEIVPETNIQEAKSEPAG